MVSKYYRPDTERSVGMDMASRDAMPSMIMRCIEDVALAHDVDWIIRHKDPPHEPVVLMESKYAFPRQLGYLQDKWKTSINLNRSIANALSIPAYIKAYCNFNIDHDADDYKWSFITHKEAKAYTDDQLDRVQISLHPINEYGTCILKWMHDIGKPLPERITILQYRAFIQYLCNHHQVHDLRYNEHTELVT